MERNLLALALSDKDDYELIVEHTNIQAHSRPFQIILEKIGAYYSRDEDATQVNVEVLLSLIKESVRNDRHYAEFESTVREAEAIDVSEANVRFLLLEAKRQEIGDKLAQAIVNGQPHAALLDEYYDLLEAQTIEDSSGSGLDAFDTSDLVALLRAEMDPATSIPVYPSSLNHRLGERVKRGHHIIVFARPETGKSLLIINIAAKLAERGFKVLFIDNEDRPPEILIRLINNLTGMGYHEVQRDLEAAVAKANELGLTNITIIEAQPGTPHGIAKLIKNGEYDVVIVNQLRNLNVKAENRTNQLEAAAVAMRNIAKKENVLMISVTQAGDSASNKRVLDMGDVDGSNTGIPAACEVMMGIGVDEALEAEGVRIISLPKNKISADHTAFPIRVFPPLSRAGSV